MLKEKKSKKNVIIKLQKICKTFDLGKVKVKAVSSVNLEVEKGEHIAIIGQSGSGKSTLMHMIGCLEKPSTGTYHLENQDISRLSDNQLAKIRREKVGFVFQTFNLLAKYNAFRNIEVPLIYKGVSKKEREKKVTGLLEKVGLSNRADHKPNELSGGQKQRVAIARALANDPEIILADEPTGNLDSKTGKEILTLLDFLNEKECVTVILVTHELEVAKYADRIVTIKDGKIVKDQKIRRKKLDKVCQVRRAL